MLAASSSYRNNRYLRHLTEEELKERFDDALINILTVSEGKIGMSPSDYWYNVFTHIQEESELRYGEIRTKFRKDHGLFTNLKILEGMAVQSLSKYKQNENSLIKFGSKQHMENLYKKGSLRIQPASYFLKENHNFAAKDHELEMTVSFVISPKEAESIAEIGDGSTIIEDQIIQFTHTLKNDFWIYCMADTVHHRLFLDFTADACVIIKDKIKFGRAIEKEMSLHFPNIQMREGHIDYIDPTQPKTVIFDIPLTKHFRYTYQNEYRFLWEAPIDGKPYIDIELGSLEHYAELVVIDNGD